MMKNATNPNFSVWVNASAGTGKTKILIDRVLRLLLENRKNILCLTFTNAAANEMETRIYNTLSKWAVCSSGELVRDLEILFDGKDHFIKARRLFFELENLNLTIQTIHAFCYQLISNFPIDVEIPPSCTLSECIELHSKAFEKVLNHLALQDEINFIATEIDENELHNLLHTLYTKRSTINVEYIRNKLNVSDQIYNLSSKTLEHIKNLSEILSHGSKRDQNYSKILHDYYSNSHTADKANDPLFQGDLSNRSRKDIENLARVFIKLESHEKKNKSSIITKSILDKFPHVDQIIDSIQNTVLSYVTDLESYQIFKRTSALLNIFKVYADFYKSEKLKNSLLDYNDIIDLATKLLNHHDYKEWVLFNLNKKIDHILIDEAQDNSISQWKIITNLCGEFFSGNEEKKTLFVVGDVKQSIYRFQGANPVLFNYMQRHFYEQTMGRGWLSLQLEESFRSTPEILMFVDKLCNNFHEEISFRNEKIEHVPHRKNDQGYIEIWPLLPKYSEKNNQQAFKVDFINEKNSIADRLIAQTIANQIYNWLNDGRILVAKNRHIEPRDIIILVRQRNVLVDYIVSEIKKANIPVSGRDHFRIMDNIVIQDLVALAEFLLLPENDLALASILKSPLFDLTEEDLFNIAYERREQSLWERLQSYSERIYNELNNLINISNTYSPLALFTHILQTGKKKFASRLGIECFEVIDEFMNLLLQFWPPSLQAFVQWIKENNPEVKNDVQLNRNTVRIMTIHKSKGLQAPVVFLVDTNTVPRNNENILFDAMEAPFWCGKNNNIYCNSIKREKKIEDYNEYLRLLYVALTRAEDEIYILGKEPVQKNAWYDLLTRYGGPYEKKQKKLHPMFQEELEIQCINSNYPYIYKKRDYFNVPVISLPEKLKKVELIEIENKKEEGFTRGKIIHNILQYMPKIEKERRSSWIKKYLENINTNEDKDEIYNKILAFNEKYYFLFELEGKSEVSLSGMFDNKPILVRLDRLCIIQDKVIIVDYKSHRSTSISSLNEIKKQMLTYRSLVQEIYPKKQIECIIIWIEDLTITSFSHQDFP